MKIPTNSQPELKLESNEQQKKSGSTVQHAPSVGGLTWAAEGQESGRFYSRKIHWPTGANSGVTIGRGYDMGQRSKAQVQADLISAGVDKRTAIKLSAGVGLRGNEAAKFVRENKNALPELTAQQELALFSKVTYPRYENEARRIATKPDVVQAYGALDVDELKNTQPELSSVLVDLLYRGDYTSGTRKILQKALVAGDKAQVCDALKEINENNQVPRARAAARNELLECKT